MTVFEATYDAVKRTLDPLGNTPRNAFWLFVPVSFVVVLLTYTVAQFVGFGKVATYVLVVISQLSLCAAIVRRLVDAGETFARPFLAIVASIIGFKVIWNGWVFRQVYHQTDCLDCGDGELAVSSAQTDLYMTNFNPIAALFSVIGVLAAAYFVALLLKPSAQVNDAPNPNEVPS